MITFTSDKHFGLLNTAKQGPEENTKKKPQALPFSPSVESFCGVSTIHEIESHFALFLFTTVRFTDEETAF
jgi:hypothetical protein